MKSKFIKIGSVAVAGFAGLLLWGAIAFFGLDRIFPVQPLIASRSFSLAVTDRNGDLLRAYLTPDDKWRLALRVGPQGAVPENIKRLLIPIEDRYFYEHPGVNPFSIARAFAANLKAGRIVSGGSTLTMQLARILEPKPRRYVSKLIEVFRAFQLEWHYSKEDLLRTFLNLAPYGGNIEGIEAASRLYFQKSPEQLTLGEAGLLVVVPNKPNRYRLDRFPAEAIRARDRVFDRLCANGWISEKERDEAEGASYAVARVPLPDAAEHLADLVLLKDKKSGWVATTADAQLQSLADSVLAEYRGDLYAKGITNAAVVVIENATGKVRALVGSLDYGNSTNQGQVNGALSARSPGSTLKPFVYALGMEEGWLTPQRLLPDVPTDYQGYVPENFDGKFRGGVSVEEALTQSLNAPAVYVLNRLGWEQFHSFLRRANVFSIAADRRRYGLSMILGGCEISLLDLTSLYAGLASGGIFRKASYLETDAKDDGARLLSEGASFLVSDILAKGDRPDLSGSWEHATNIPRIAWKTGTSYGQKDAWSVGYNPRYTIGVWTGNFAGQGNTNLVGARAAAPLLFRLFNALEEKERVQWFRQPPGLAKREVCALSGEAAGPYCPHKKSDWQLSGISRNETCSLHRPFEIDQATGYRVCSYCRQGRAHAERVFEIWPEAIGNWRRVQGYPVDDVPQHFPACQHRLASQPPKILSPATSQKFILRPGVSSEDQKILLKGEVGLEVQKVFWFVNDDLYWAGSPTERVFFQPHPGAYRIVLMDEEGQSASRDILVE
ncbi:MAG TPA: penicillin-binding protein 1C [bacterium]|nr:penicillin-binding protein 1C [bacterium]